MRTKSSTIRESISNPIRCYVTLLKNSTVPSRRFFLRYWHLRVAYFAYAFWPTPPRYLEEIGAPYEDVNAATVDRTSLAYPHPFGSMPAATDDGGVSLFESGAILLFAADKYGGLDTPEKRAAVTKWVLWANASLDPICFTENDRGQVIGSQLLAGSPRALKVLDGLLTRSTWLLGSGDDDFSVADVAVASYLLYTLLFFPNVRARGAPAAQGALAPPSSDVFCPPPGA
jgi:glutathione S-transferase